jgi:hypothetical protein
MKRFWMIVSAALIGPGATAQTFDYAVDQAHDLPEAFEGSHSLIAYPTITQEFTPTHSALNVVEIYTRDWGMPAGNGLGATLAATIRADTTNGAVLAVSGPVVLPDGWEGVSRFEFAELVPLTPGNRYALEVRLLAGDNWGVDSYGLLWPSYAGGRYFVGPHQVNGTDMWFRTGVRPPPVRLVSEGAQIIRWEGIPPLYYSVWKSTTLTNWAWVGWAQPASGSYAFTNQAPGSGAVFFQVSFP